MKARDWSKEKEDVDLSGEFFKARADKNYEIEFLNEGGDVYEKTFDDQVRRMRDFKIRVTGGGYKEAEKTWSMIVGGPKSLYAKIVAVFKHADQATGVVIHIKAEGEKLDRKYHIKEYTDLQFEDTSEAKK